MVYNETINEMIKENKQDCINELEDIKKGMKLLLNRAIDVLPDDSFGHLGSIKRDSKSSWFSKMLQQIEENSKEAYTSMTGAIYELKEYLEDQEKRNLAYFQINLMSSEELEEFLKTRL